MSKSRITSALFDVYLKEDDRFEIVGVCCEECTHGKYKKQYKVISSEKQKTHCYFCAEPVEIKEKEAHPIMKWYLLALDILESKAS